MGIAAYNRGSVLISRQLDAEKPSPEAMVLDRLNSLPKLENAIAPFGDIHFVAGNEGWWAECPITEFGFHYRTLDEAVQRWKVAIVSVGMLNGELVYKGVVSG